MEVRERFAADDAANCTVDGQSVSVPVVHAADVGRELVPQAAQLLGLGRPVDCLLTAGFPGVLQLGEYIKLSGLARMQFETELAKADLPKPTEPMTSDARSWPSSVIVVGVEAPSAVG